MKTRSIFVAGRVGEKRRRTQKTAYLEECRAYDKKMYEQKTEAILQPIVDANGFELVDVEYVKEGGSWYLRAYIDKPGGITVDDCELVSRAANDILDEQDFVEESYIFEVSSPGLGRPLKKRRILCAALGKKWRSARSAR